MTSYEMAKNIVELFLTQELRSGNSLTREVIQQTVERINEQNRFGLSSDDCRRLTRELESEYQTVIGRETELRGDDSNWNEWLRGRAADIDWGYWLRYKKLLAQGSFNETVLARMEQSTDRTLNLMGDPARESRWDRRGLVVGLVQSGKTAHYVGVMNKAIDAGYKVIVVLTGFNENLRVQTQIRAEEGLLGYSIKPSRDNPSVTVSEPCGVGLVKPLNRRVDTVTTRRNDFKTSIANNFGIQPGGNPILFVVKKNATVLKNLLSWVVNFASAEDAEGVKYVSGIPLLVIDDESDVGSVDTKKGAVDELGEVDRDHDPSKINKQVRKLLSLFDQSSYVGYTATPFANVLIHDLLDSGVDPEDKLMVGEDLFPRSFIVSLPSPSNHVGPSEIFGSRTEDIDGLPIIRTVDDASTGGECWMPEKHKKDHVPLTDGQYDIPPSLRRAILSFILVIAARMIRGDGNRHNSMLVHVTRFVDVQGRVYEQVAAVVAGVRDRLRNNTATEGLMAEFRDLWERGVEDESGRNVDKGFVETSGRIASHVGEEFDGEIHDWEDIRECLREAVEKIDVRRIHGSSGEDLDYQDHPNGLNVIAIGGDKLSRGLTLEGLSVSYFLRCSRMYDTLMQMGRWFGYRPRYLDLCRLYTTERLCRWFAQIADAAEELRLEFDRMSLVKCTPKEFGLRVRSHPEMLVTSAVKMRHGATMQVTFQGSILETIDFSRRRGDIENNWIAGSDLIEGLDPVLRVDPEMSPAKYEWADVDPAEVTRFLRGYRQHPAARKVRPDLFAQYIEGENRAGRLLKWRILVATGAAGEEGGEFSLGDHTGSCVLRAWNLSGGDTDLETLKGENHFRIRRLVSPSHERAGMPRGSEAYEEAMRLTIEAWEKKKREGETVGDRPTVPYGTTVREVRSEQEGVLILYPLQSDDDNAEDGNELPILGFAISFPTVSALTATHVTYEVNNVYQLQEGLS
jgi:hypothetical protein